jgi:predicted Zn-dependent peptidase
MSSRLFQEVRERRGLAYSVYSYHSMYAETGVFVMYAGTTPSRADEVVELLRGQAGDVAERGLEPEELERAKGHVKGSLVLSLEDTSGRMSRLGRSEIGHGEILSIDEIVERVESIGADDARRAAGRVLGHPLTLAVLGPVPEESFGGSDSAGLEVAAHHGEGAGP